MRLQLALNVSNLEEAISFYRKLLGVAVHKREPGYANFVVDDPALKLVLFESGDSVNKLNHLGVEVFDDAEVAAAGERWRANGLEPDDPSEEVCCYAKQNKVKTFDPDGTMWEWYRVIEDVPAEVGTSARAGGCC